MKAKALIAAGFFVGGAFFGYIGGSTPEPPAMVCHEDEVMRWVDAPYKTECLPVDHFFSEEFDARVAGRSQ